MGRTLWLWNHREDVQKASGSKPTDTAERKTTGETREKRGRHAAPRAAGTSAGPEASSAVSCHFPPRSAAGNIQLINKPMNEAGIRAQAQSKRIIKFTSQRSKKPSRNQPGFYFTSRLPNISVPAVLQRQKELTVGKPVKPDRSGRFSQRFAHFVCGRH